MTTQYLTQLALYIRVTGIITQTIALVALLTSCQPKVSDQQLKTWHQEAVAENDRLVQTSPSPTDPDLAPNPIQC
jgi:hypothetical protein